MNVSNFKVKFIEIKSRTKEDLFDVFYLFLYRKLSFFKISYVSRLCMKNKTDASLS